MKTKNKRILYLAGGFRSGWQRAVSEQLPNFEILDPSRHEIVSPADYVKWDLDAVKKCDVVLANMEASNPGGYALALEIGYAKALGKTIILVESHADSVRERYFEMVRHVADITFQRLQDALRYLSEK